jgi:hypothetical protein
MFCVGFCAGFCPDAGVAHASAQATNSDTLTFETSTACLIWFSATFASRVHHAPLRTQPAMRIEGLLGRLSRDWR